MLCRRKVLVLLDDVDQLEQLEALAGSHNWFGCGSRVIITTRDEHLLKVHKVDKICPLRLLSDKEAIGLFNKHAYNEKELMKDYDRLSLQVVSYAAGLPLALKVLGSFLKDKNKDQWISTLSRLKGIPDDDIVKKLKISYDGLKTDEKQLFLDIACFCRGHWKSHVIDIFEACGFYFERGIEVLRQKSLITIGAYNTLEMHDLVQEMGLYIFIGERAQYYSRLWKIEDIKNMCLTDATKKSEIIEGIISYNIRGDHASHFCNNVSNMKKLRWLKVETSIHDDYVRVAGPNFLSNELRFIDWRGYPGISFPDSFQPLKLVVLVLIRGSLEILWTGYKDLPCLKVLRLNCMKNLVNTPDFTGLPCLQKLELVECVELKEIHPSLGNHASLECVRVSHCYKLRKFPAIIHMEKLQTLEISVCYKIFEFPEIRANMESLVNLSLSHVGIQVLPSLIGERCTNLTSLSFYYLKNLKSIEFHMDALKCLKEFTYFSTSHIELLLYNPKTSFHEFPHSLQKLNLCQCDLDGKVLSAIIELTNLEELDLSYNYFSRLDFSLLQLTRLKLLNISHCSRLVELPKLPSNVAILRANFCDLLTAVTDSLTNCKCLCEVSLHNGGIITDGGKVLESMLQGKAIETRTMIFRLRGQLEVAKVFIPGICRGNKCRLQLPENWRNEFCGFLIYGIGKSTFDYGDIEITVMQVKSDSIDSQREVVWEESDDDREMCDDDTAVVNQESDYDSEIDDDDDDDDDDDADTDMESDGDRNRWVAYISFASLRDVSWWNQTYNQLSFGIEDYEESCSGFGVKLIRKETDNGSPRGSQNSNYSRHFSIDNVSAYGLKIRFP